jgi:hypothetical protein
MAMTQKTLAKLMHERLESRGISVYQLANKLSPKVSHGTVYNAMSGKVIKTDTLLLLFDVLDLEITKKGSRK